jgi:hypothetical protein
MADLYEQWIEKAEGRKGRFITNEEGRVVFIGGPGAGGGGAGGSGVTGLVGLSGQDLVNYVSGGRSGFWVNKLPRGLILKSGDTTLTVDRSNGAVISGIRGGSIDLRNQSAEVIGEDPDYLIQGSFL